MLSARKLGSCISVYTRRAPRGFVFQGMFDRWRLCRNVLTIRDICHVSGELKMAAPRLQSHLPLGFHGASYDKSGWCFVEACGMICGTSDTNECMALLVGPFTFVRLDNVTDDSPPVCCDDRR